jgi:3-hydroxymyristoyl/3-hydroxydecanoyl-(acyl carrier protein) dehydratase
VLCSRPVRYLLLDRITSLEAPTRATGVKCISLADDVFVDHFPGLPVMPGCLILEALAQLGGVLVERTIQDRGRHDLHALLTMVNRAKFRQIVRPGDRLDLEATGLAVQEDGGQVKGVARVEGKVVTEAELTYVFAPLTNPRLRQRRRDILSMWMTGTVEDEGDVEA